jgi:hypothetical protein
MALDMNKMLPGTGGKTTNRRKGGGGTVVILLLLTIVGGAGYGAYLVFNHYQESITGFFTDTGDQKQPLTTSTEKKLTPDDSMPTVTSITTPKPVEDSKSPTDKPTDSTSTTSGAVTDKIPASPDSVRSQSQVQRLWVKVLKAEQVKDTSNQKSLLRMIIKAHGTDEHGAMAYYRLGLLYWRLGEKRKGEDTWKHAYEHLSASRGGRLSALALADLWFVHFAGATPDRSQWEAIRDAYSCAMGMDRADFIPEGSRKRAMKRLQELNQTLVFTRYPCRGSQQYVVKKRDTLDQIARYFGVLKGSIISITLLVAGGRKAQSTEIANTHTCRQANTYPDPLPGWQVGQAISRLRWSRCQDARRCLFGGHPSSQSRMDRPNDRNSL